MSILTWVYSKKDELGIEFSTDNWTEKSGLKLYDYETTIKQNDLKLVGRGVDELEPIAIIKSVSETIERLICREFDVSSVGLSIQSDDKSFDASVHAKDEVLERFYLKKHIDLEIPFRLFEQNSSIVKLFKLRNVSSMIQFFKMNTPIGYYGIGCLLELNGKTSVGFSFSYNEMKAIEKSFIEALPNLFWLQDSDIKNDDLPWHLQSEFVGKIKQLLNPIQTNLKTETVLPEIIGRKIDLSGHDLLATAPIEVISFRIKDDI